MNISPAKKCSEDDASVFAANQGKRVNLGGKYAIVVYFPPEGSGSDHDKAALGAIAAASAAAGTGTVTVATITTTAPAWGIAGWLGFTTTTVSTVAFPVAGGVIVAGVAMWGAYRVYKAMSRREPQVALDFGNGGGPTIPGATDDCASRIVALFPEFNGPNCK